MSEQMEPLAAVLEVSVLKSSGTNHSFWNPCVGKASVFFPQHAAIVGMSCKNPEPFTGDLPTFTQPQRVDFFFTFCGIHLFITVENIIRLVSPSQKRHKKVSLWVGRSTELEI